ncbi:MAG: transcription termination/antitermination protein NusG, partial [Bacteroidota bacterium]|nr:transcription termination/antitermination protein NusG [Bacteroidota bacterium]
YVLRVITGQEKKVKQYIENEMRRENLSHQLSQILIPMEKVMQLKNGKKITKERNYFPGYIMIEALLDGEAPHVIKSVPSVVGFLGAKGSPEPLRLSEINRMLGKVDALNESGDNFEVPFLVGEPVKVTDGPFKDFSGVIEEINEEKKKLKVIVKIFGRRTPLELNYIQVEKE